MGGGGSEGVSVLAIHSNDRSLNLSKVYSFISQNCEKRSKINSKEAWDGPIKSYNQLLTLITKVSNCSSNCATDLFCWQIYVESMA